MFDRKSIRLRGYDYRKDGYYFVTIRVRKKKCLFGTIVDGMMYLNHAGKMVEDEWLLLTKRFPHISLDEYVIMPNHMHGIIVIGNPDTRASIKDAPTSVRAAFMAARVSMAARGPVIDAREFVLNNADMDSCSNTDMHMKTKTRASIKDAPTFTETLVQIIGAFKSITTNAYIRGVKQNGWPTFDRQLWQRNYYERIVRYDGSLDRIRSYIFHNPFKWEQDTYHQSC